ncbi:helix-turn-helix domain-containing protein [Aquimarina sp. RZ0]|uniref:helix-turn-helix domain-containing protein n=1 Tax=Aquimarina sp. RZ0 TaxID=2607730 RepID=UPI0011F10647|nr:helix-turn-helix domain-containing protein [Aquimarina sp. RZ0]KAA1243279.1 AraC family transcriptional regulator [Aquimarina sp. RZ0]
MQQNLIPSFDTWTSIFLLVSSFGFFLSIVLCIHKNGRKNNLPIILLILGFSFVLLYYVLIWTGFRSVYPYLYFFDTSWYLVFGPLLYRYITRFYNHTFRAQWYHFLPSLVCFFMNGIYYIKTQGLQNKEMYTDEFFLHFLSVVNNPWLPALSFIIYFITVKDFIAFHKSEKKSEYEATRKKWTTLLLHLFSVFSLAYISYYILVKFSFFSIHWDYAISFSMSIGMYAIGFMVYKEPSIFNGELLSHLFIKETGHPAFTDKTTEEFYTKLLNHITTNKSYLNNNLRLVQLADEVGFSSHTLSKIINEKAHKNFNQFINEYRLQEAEKLLREHTSPSIKTIYYEVGFNNKATFNNAFKNKHHCTPSAYKRKYLQVQDP